MIEPPVILSVDTATMGGSVCLTRGTLLLATRIGDPGVSHSNSLLRDINEGLSEARVSLTEVDLFAAAQGPGSFTGLRIGLATVKALAATLRISCVGIPTLHAVALGGGPSPATVALMPAGRGEGFVQLLSVASNGTVTPLDEPAHLPPQKVFERYRSIETLKWSGPGAHLYREVIESYAREVGIGFNGQISPETFSLQGWSLVPSQQNLSQQVAALALQKYLINQVSDPLSLSAMYVRPSDAELKCP